MPDADSAAGAGPVIGRQQFHPQLSLIVIAAINLCAARAYRRPFRQGELAVADAAALPQNPGCALRRTLTFSSLKPDLKPISALPPSAI
jgi:hypothetical protein